MKRIILLGAVAAICLAPGPLQAQPAPYRAIGTEPFWSLRIDGGRMVYEDAERRRISVRTPAARPSFNGRRYVTLRLKVDITRQRCSDGMSDRIYAETVRVMADGRALSGCGGAILPPETLAGTSWRIMSIAGTDVSGGDDYEIGFETNRLSGRAGCNRFNGSYRVTRDGFQAGPLAMTRMACPGDRMAHEQELARIMTGRLRLYYPDGQTLVMRGGAGEIRLRRIG